ncbi:hypothetical protein SEA_OBLADI_126 [Gordonia phage ObLaDi]|uniref:Uncharacterized protein n=1 Tax=Gordonia phage ObLaDi TaxID=2978487 RepID=A0A977KLV2_9CAUD|nr:hypothetical protein SEA_OBLADI_126 [Gordonia phage ObLaDi]
MHTPTAGAGVTLPRVLDYWTHKSWLEVEVDWGEHFGPHRDPGSDDFPIEWEVTWCEQVCDRAPGVFDDGNLETRTEEGLGIGSLAETLTQISYTRTGAVAVSISGWALWMKGHTTAHPARGYEFPTPTPAVAA